jgi:hypothetical protein
MLVTSVVIPPVASAWWLVGLARRRRLLAAGPDLGAAPPEPAAARAGRWAGPFPPVGGLMQNRRSTDHQGRRRTAPSGSGGAFVATDQTGG